MAAETIRRVFLMCRAGLNPLFVVVRALVWVLAGLSGLAILAMIAITCADVIGRRFGHPVVGALDMVKLASAVVIAGGLPYTTAVKGHVAIEYFFHKLSHRWRTVVDTFARLLVIGFFIALAKASVQLGARILATGQVSATLQLPIFWTPYLIALSAVVVALVVLYNLLHPGKEMIRP